MKILKYDEYGHDALTRDIERLTARYPFICAGTYGKSVMGRELPYLRIGGGCHRVLYNAAHHANEWITSPLLMRFIEQYAEALDHGGSLSGFCQAVEVFVRSTVYIAPMVNPDGVELVLGNLCSGSDYDGAAALWEASGKTVPFPSGWKANLRGVDLNLQYPAGWDKAREIKYAAGYDKPGPRDYVGGRPLEAPESRALFDLTLELDPALTLSYHSQGETIYWKYSDYEPPRSREVGTLLCAVSGYAMEETPAYSGNAGYKDWFIERFGRPGYTIEVGLGESPLPFEQFDKIYRDNLGILTLCASCL